MHLTPCLLLLAIHLARLLLLLSDRHLFHFTKMSSGDQALLIGPQQA